MRTALLVPLVAIANQSRANRKLFRVRGPLGHSGLLSPGLSGDLNGSTQH